MCGLGEKMTEADVEFLLNDLTDLSGMVKYADFVKKLCSSEEDWRADAWIDTDSGLTHLYCEH